MRDRLVRLYPAGWRARYGDEFLALLEERPLGPFDVADILLGALDAQLRLRRVGADMATGRSPSMSLRIGGYAAILGGASLAVSIILGIGVVGDVPPVVPGTMLLIGSVALVIALAGLSAFQARKHPVLSWAAVAIATGGAVAATLGIVGMWLFRDGYWDVFVLGVICGFVGSTLFAIATYRTAALSRGAAALVGASSVLTIVGGFGGDSLPPAILIGTTIAFATGWFVLGVLAVRLDRPATAPGLV